MEGFACAVTHTPRAWRQTPQPPARSSALVSNRSSYSSHGAFVASVLTFVGPVSVAPACAATHTPPHPNIDPESAPQSNCRGAAQPELQLRAAQHKSFFCRSDRPSIEIGWCSRWPRTAVPHDSESPLNHAVSPMAGARRRHLLALPSEAYSTTGCTLVPGTHWLDRTCSHRPPATLSPAGPRLSRRPFPRALWPVESTLESRQSPTPLP